MIGIVIDVVYYVSGLLNVRCFWVILSGVCVDRVIGVFYGFCVGFGVILINLDKLKVWFGVLGKRLFLFGVVIMDEGRLSLLFFGGGVDGGFI